MSFDTARRRRDNHHRFGNRGGLSKTPRIWLPQIPDGKIGGMKIVKITHDTLRAKLYEINKIVSGNYISHSPVRELKDMTLGERAAIEERYGAKIL